LGAGAASLLVSAWLFAGERGVVAVSAGTAFGWMVRHVMPVAVTSVPAVLPGEILADPAAERLGQLEARTASLRHDLRGILSPALLIAERLLNHEDPAIHRAGEIMVKTVERASARMAETKA
jgi:hypothetical protein